jgi:hypothetical protein
VDGVEAYSDYRMYRDQGDSVPLSAAKAGVEAGAGIVGAGHGTVVGGAACASTGMGLAVSPVCAAVGGVAGGIMGKGAVKNTFFPQTHYAPSGYVYGYTVQPLSVDWNDNCKRPDGPCFV